VEFSYRLFAKRFVFAAQRVLPRRVWRTCSLMSESRLVELHDYGADLDVVGVYGRVKLVETEMVQLKAVLWMSVEGCALGVDDEFLSLST
jgi:hypothetical protein